MRIDAQKELRDPIHGLIRLTDQEIAIVNTRVFQRLRRIRQLAMADLVYPGAVHTRFEHSLGTMHLAHRILGRLDDLEPTSAAADQAICVRLAALLHDIGHGPFSHVSEYLLEEYSDKSKLPSAAAREKIHELLTVDIITKDPELAAQLTEEQRQSVVSIIRGSGIRDYRHDIISSSLDADKMDYLLRDAYFAGVQYGQYDLDKVIDVFRILRRGSESYLMVSEEGIYAVEQLVLSKHHMTQQVYAHRIRTITDLMIVRGLELAIETDDNLHAIYSYDGSDDHLKRYLDMDDSRLCALVLASDDERARSIFQRLRDRDLFRELALLTLDASHVPDTLTLTKLVSLSSNDRKELERIVATKLGCQEWEVIVHMKSVKNPAYQPPGVLDPEAIWVISRDGQPRLFSEYDEILIARLPATERLHVIGPWTPPKDLPREQWAEARKQLEKEIISLILTTTGG